ncbi:hypothetical protein [Klebsiella quasipneumoniae]|uniref:hypothetical protein n=1 Tax=Klebsiella quasipneumoniae TaxID=1463165 RepID=UPI003DA19A3D
MKVPDLVMYLFVVEAENYPWKYNGKHYTLDKQANKQTSKQANKQANKQTSKQANKQTSKQINEVKI